MRHRLKIKFLQAILLVCAVLLLASVTQAGTSHHHHSEEPSVESPFDKVNKGKPLHCILNMHQHFQNIPCPHQDEKAQNSELRSDCGTNSGSANSSSSSSTSDLLKKMTDVVIIPGLLASKIGLLTDNDLQSLPRAIDHPPQLA
jgi:hypothetical protein